MDLIFASCLHSQCPLTQQTLKRYQIFATEGWYQMRRFDVWDDLPVTHSNHGTNSLNQFLMKKHLPFKGASTIQ